jgi:hypothetical protein
LISFAFLPQLLSPGFLLGGKQRRHLRFRFFSRGTHLLMKDLGACLVICGERALSSFLSQFSQLSARSFIVCEVLLDDRASLLLLSVGQIQFMNYAGAEAALAGTTTETATFSTTHPFRSLNGSLSRSLLSLDSSAKRGQ